MLPKDPLPEFQLDLRDLVNEVSKEGVLNKRERLFLLPITCSTPYLPKVYKSLHNPPGRPIVAGTLSFTNKLSKYIDCFLQPIVQQLPSYIRNSGHVLEVLWDYMWESDYMWASLDVCSPYTFCVRVTNQFLKGPIFGGNHKILFRTQLFYFSG